MAVFSKGMDAR